MCKYNVYVKKIYRNSNGKFVHKKINNNMKQHVELINDNPLTKCVIMYISEPMTSQAVSPIHLQCKLYSYNRNQIHCCYYQQTTEIRIRGSTMADTCKLATIMYDNC